MIQTDFLSPILVHADSFLLTANGATANANPTQLANPNRTPMLVDEFRFAMGAPPNVSSPAVATAPFFSSWVVDIKLGNTPLTNGPIPLRSFAPIYTRYMSVDSGPGLSDRMLTWHLPRPMYVPPDVQINVAIYRKDPSNFVTDSFADFATVPGFVGIAGRSMPSGMVIPDKIYVPWACATSVYDSSVPFTSNDADISNPFDEVMALEYFTGYNCTGQAGGSVNTVVRTPITIQATFSNGKILLRDPAPLLTLFPPDRPVLRVSGRLQPKEFVKVMLDLPNPTSGTYAFTNMNFTTVGMVGFRELQTPQGARP